MSTKCEVCGCVCSNCGQSQECGQLREEVQQLYQKLSETTQKIIELESYIRHQQQLAETVQKKHTQELQAFQEKVDRLKESNTQSVERNQQLEEKLLEVVSNANQEKDHYEHALLLLTQQLVNTKDEMNKIEIENVQNRKDCSLVVQLLKCNQNTDKGSISSQLPSLTNKMQEKLKSELGVEPSSTAKPSSLSQRHALNTKTQKPSQLAHHKQPKQPISISITRTPPSTSSRRTSEEKEDLSDGCVSPTSSTPLLNNKPAAVPYSATSVRHSSSSVPSSFGVSHTVEDISGTKCSSKKCLQTVYTGPFALKGKEKVSSLRCTNL